MGFEPQSWDLGLKTGIWALRLGFESGGMGKTDVEQGSGVGNSP